MQEETKTKYDEFDISTFKPEPPLKSEHIMSLFVGREVQLRRGIEVLKKHSDAEGRKRIKLEKQPPWIISGESRVGKSHLARRIILGLPKSGKRKYIIIPSRERLNATEVMKVLFEKLKEIYYQCINSQEKGKGQYRKSIIAVNEIIDKVSSFPPGADEVTLTLSESTKETVDVGVDIGIIPQIFNFISKLSVDWTEENSRSVKLRTPTARDYAEYCSLMSNILIHFKLLKHICVLVDDVDLLEGYVDMTRNGSIQRSILSDSLAMFHETPGVDVILTARSWYANSRKELQTLIDLSSAKPLSVPEMVKIHDLRFKLYNDRSLHSRFLNNDALMIAANDALSMPGIFLQHLDFAFQEYLDEESWEERDYNWYFEVMSEKYNIFKEKCPQAATKLEGAIGNGQNIIDVSNNNPFHQTIFENTFVWQSYFQETTYFIDGLVYKIIENKQTDAK